MINPAVMYFICFMTILLDKNAPVHIGTPPDGAGTRGMLFLYALGVRCFSDEKGSVKTRTAFFQAALS
ncbi:hypothetical protein KJ975_11775 [Myxococcota bacterium]|nr:hypothetical protein [Myxococcota bacterium]